MFDSFPFSQIKWYIYERAKKAWPFLWIHLLIDIIPQAKATSNLGELECCCISNHTGGSRGEDVVAVPNGHLPGLPMQTGTGWYCMELYLCHYLERAIIYSEHTFWNFEHVKIYFANTAIIFENEITLEQTKIDSMLHKSVCILVFIITIPWCTNSPLCLLTSPKPPSLDLFFSACSSCLLRLLNITHAL